jgi:hypothetical protein
VHIQNKYTAELWLQKIWKGTFTERETGRITPQKLRGNISGYVRYLEWVFDMSEDTQSILLKYKHGIYIPRFSKTSLRLQPILECESSIIDLILVGRYCFYLTEEGVFVFNIVTREHQLFLKTESVPQSIGIVNRKIYVLFMDASIWFME